jgi:GPH family glycoside/pentoside/hexuronide:cation symporter
MPMFSRMVIYISTYVIDRPALASEILFALALGQFPGVALWTYLVRFGEKTTLLAISYIVASAGIIVFAVAGSRPSLLICISVLIGIGLSGVYMLPWGIWADFVDFAEFRHRERREAATFAGMLVILKAGAAACLGTIGLILSEVGYAPGMHQTPKALFAMKAMAFGVPVIGSIVAIIALKQMDVGHRRHARILRALKARTRHHGSSGSIGSTRIDEIEG